MDTKALSQEEIEILQKLTPSPEEVSCQIMSVKALNVYVFVDGKV